MAENQYTEDNIRSLDWKEHIRLRPGMYIGKLGDGSSADDGIYILVKEVVDNCIDEFVMGNGKRIDITVKDGTVTVRDFGRGIPLGKVKDVVSKMNTGGKYDSKAFQKSVGLNGVGTKAVNALSSHFLVYSVRDGKKVQVSFKQGNVVEESPETKTDEENGTYVEFIPDDTVFKKFAYKTAYLEKMIWNYCYLNRGLTIKLNGQRFISKNGLKDLLENNMDGDPLYPVIHLEGDDIEVAFTHGKTYGEDYYSFVNGQHTTQGGTHQSAFRESVAKVIKDFYGKSYEASDIRQSIVAAVAVKVMEPVFESQTKTKLGSLEVEPGGESMRAFINNFLKQKLDNFLHRNPDVADILEKKIRQSEKERKELSGIRKIARERAKKANLHNKKLRDCRVHLTDAKHERREERNPEITRFKGLGEISPDEFKNFIGEDMRLEPVILSKESSIETILSYYMGKNTQQRQEFIIDNLRVEESVQDDKNELEKAS